jgi:hypothetical protein|tara:strand:+ start:711 stop:974 length:264 start_codon:yes stop_codon:yes gene_type:complete
MNDEIFDKVTIDEMIEKIKQDKTGRMALLMQEIMDVCEKAGKRGFTMKELSIIATTGWFLSQNPDLREFFNNLMSLPKPDGDEEIWN